MLLHTKQVGLFLLTAVMTVAAPKFTVDGIYSFSVVPTDGLPAGVNLGDIATLIGGTYTVTCPATSLAIDPVVLVGAATTAGIPYYFVSGKYQTAPAGVVGGGSATITEAEIDFGAAAVKEKTFTITDGTITTLSKIVVLQSGKAPTGRSADENELDNISFRAQPLAGTFNLYANCTTGRVSGKYKINYMVG